jgi:nucleoside-diphosphate-sugar epimerase
VVIVQPGLIYGPGDTSSVRTMLVDYLRRKLPLVPKQTAYAWAHVDDIARGHMLAMEKGQPGRNYFICGPVHTLEEALDMVRSITGIPTPRLHVGPFVLRVMAASMAMVEQLVPLPPSYTSEGLRVVAGVTYIGSNARARSELGWRPRPLREGLMETLRHEILLLGMTPRF